MDTQPHHHTNNQLVIFFLIFFLSLFLVLQSQRTANAQDPDLSNLINLLSSIPEGDWIHVNKDKSTFNTFASQWPVLDESTNERANGRSSDLNPAKIISAWSSFAWDKNRGDLWLFGGGHNNYSGNEVYRWRGTTLNWERMSKPSQVQPLNPGSENSTISWYTVDGATVTGPDSAPSSAHTYDLNIFLPNADRLLVFGGSDYNHGRPWSRRDGTPTGPYFFDPNKADPNKVGGVDGTGVGQSAAVPNTTIDSNSMGGAMWENRDIYNNLQVPQTSPSGYINGVSGYSTDSQDRDVIYVTGRQGGSTNQNLYKYTIIDVNDPTADLWETVGIFFDGTNNQGAGAYSPTSNAFVRTGLGNTVFMYWDLSLAGPDNRSRSVPSTMINDVSGEFQITEQCTADGFPCDGMDYDPRRDQFLLWNGSGGTVWALTLPADLSAQWTVTKLVPSAGSDIPPTVDFESFRGVLGKWKYIPNLDAYMALENPTEGNIWLYKPIGWQPPAVSILIDDFD